MTPAESYRAYTGMRSYKQPIENKPVSNNMSQALSDDQLRAAVNLAQVTAPTKTIKAEAWSRHQRVSDVSNKTKSFGIGTVPLEVIEQQIILDRGEFAPTNIAGISLEELHRDALALSDSLGKPPSAPTPYSILGDTVRTPYHFYKEAGGTVADPSLLNSIKLAEAGIGMNVHTKPVHTSSETTPAATTGLQDNSISLERLGHEITRKITTGSTYYDDRCIGYVSYFRWLADTLEASQEHGTTYTEALAAWETRQQLCKDSIRIYEEQLAYTNSLTDAHRRELASIKEFKALKAKTDNLELIIQERVTTAVAAALKSKPRGRPVGSKNKPKPPNTQPPSTQPPIAQSFTEGS